MTSLNEIIQKAMSFILTGDTHTLGILREQFKNSTISNIDKSSVGCFTEFSVNEKVEKVMTEDVYIGDVFLESKQITSGMGIILFIKKGVISMLEFYTYGDDVLPDSFEDYKFVYGNGERDFNTYLK